MEILISIFIGLGLMELYAWLDPLAKLIVKLVARSLPEAAQADFIEQFTADLDALPNSLAKIFFAVRDCALSIGSIRDAAYRNVLASVADQHDSLLVKIASVEPSLDQARATFSKSWGSALKFVKMVDDTSRNMDARLTPDNLIARRAVEDFRETCAPLVQYFSSIETTFEQNIAAIEAAVESLSRSYTAITPMMEKLRERLCDPRPLDNDDDKFCEKISEAVEEIINSAETTPKLRDFPARPADLTDRLKATGRASDVVVRSFSRTTK